MKSIQIIAALAFVSLPFAVACGGAPGGASTGSTSSASSAESCESASECSGFLPESVEVCSDGSSEAAHWECKKHSCEITYCSGKASACEASERPAACPGGGEASCKDGAWACAPLPTAPTGNGCDASQQPAACPGGGEASCTDGAWACAPLPTGNGCDASQQPAACPGGGEASCTDGAWACAPLPTADAGADAAAS